jgi:hypothetical protein
MTYIKGVRNMPRGKELEQLPMASIAPGAGKDASNSNREILESIVQQDQPRPGDVEKENEDMV